MPCISIETGRSHSYPVRQQAPHACAHSSPTWPVRHLVKPKRSQRCKHDPSRPCASRQQGVTSWSTSIAQVRLLTGSSGSLNGHHDAPTAKTLCADKVPEGSSSGRSTRSQHAHVFATDRAIFDSRGHHHTIHHQHSDARPSAVYNTHSSDIPVLYKWDPGQIQAPLWALSRFP